MAESTAPVLRSPCPSLTRCCDHSRDFRLEEHSATQHVATWQSGRGAVTASRPPLWTWSLVHAQWPHLENGAKALSTPVCSPSVSRAGFNRRSILCSSSACERSEVSASKSFILELGVARLQGTQMCGTLTCLHRGRPNSGGPGFTSQVTTRPAGGSAKANARAE